MPPVDPPLDPFTPLENWALFNLLLTIITGIIMAALLITWFTKRKEDEDADGINKRPLYRIVSIVATIVAIVIFVLTENMSLPMILTDSYTVYHLLIAAVQIVVAVLARKKYEEKKADSTQA
jgi:amino acid transporter